VIIMELGRLVAAGKVAELARAEKETVFELELADVSPEALGKIRSVAHVKAANETGRRTVAVALDDSSDEILDNVAAQLFLAHLPIVSFHRQGHRLEEIFMAKTEGKVQ